jgi:hypothetical protein
MGFGAMGFRLRLMACDGWSGRPHWTGPQSERRLWSQQQPKTTLTSFEVSQSRLLRSALSAVQPQCSGGPAAYPSLI